jgi:hypothetical protein
MKKGIDDEWNDIYAFLALVVVKGDRVVMRYIQMRQVSCAVPRSVPGGRQITQVGRNKMVCHKNRKKSMTLGACDSALQAFH